MTGKPIKVWTGSAWVPVGNFVTAPTNLSQGSIEPNLINGTALTEDIVENRGDLIVGSNNGVSNEPVGQDGTVLMADSLQANGLKWQKDSESVLRALPNPAPVAEKLLKQSVWWIDAQHSSACEQKISNLGWGGSVLDAKDGSVDSGLRIRSGYVYLPGAIGNTLSISDSSWQTDGDLDVQAHIALDDWTPADVATIAGSFNTSNTTRNFGFFLLSSGHLRLSWSTGTGTNNPGSSTTVAAIDGQSLWVRATLDANNGSGQYEVKFYTSDDGVSWTQLGTTITGSATVRSIHSSTEFRVGTAHTGTSPLAGKIYRVKYAPSIDGVPTVDIDCAAAQPGDTQFLAATGQVVTVNNTSNDSNDPKFLDWNGTDYVYLPGVTGNFLSVPDSNDLDITGDIDIRCHVAMDDWTPAAINTLVSKYGDSGNISWTLQVQTTGRPLLVVSADGINTTSAAASAGFLVYDGSDLWVRATWRASDGRVQYFQSVDGLHWTQVGSDATANVGSLFSSSTRIAVGQRDSSSGQVALAGKIYRTIIKSGIDGTTVLDVDTSAITSGSATSFTANTGQTVTINRSTTGRKSVAVVAPCWLFGTDDYMEVADNDLIDFGATDSFTVLAVGRRWPTLASEAWIAKKTAASTAGTVGWAQVVGSGGTVIGYIGDEVTQRSGTATNGNPGSVLVTAVLVRNVATDKIDSYGNGATGGQIDNTTGTLANSEVMRVGRFSGEGTSYAAAEIFAAAVWRRALTAQEIATISTYFESRIA